MRGARSCARMPAAAMRRPDDEVEPAVLDQLTDLPPGHVVRRDLAREQEPARDDRRRATQTRQHDDEEPRHVEREHRDRDHDADDEADHERDHALLVADDPPGRGADRVAHRPGEDRDRRVVVQVRQRREDQGDDETDDPAGHRRERAVTEQRPHAFSAQAEPDDEAPQRQQHEEEPPAAEGERQSDHDGQDGHHHLHPITSRCPGPERPVTPRSLGIRQPLVRPSCAGRCRTWPRSSAGTSGMSGSPSRS